MKFMSLFSRLIVAAVVAASSTSAWAISVTIPVGTRVMLNVEGTISPETHTEGQSVLFACSQDVVVDGKVVIKAGASGIGEVSASTPKGSVGKAASISIRVHSVTAADGSTVPLRGTKTVKGESKQTESLGITVLCCIAGLLMKGEDAAIIEGSTIDGTVLSSVDVDV